METGISVLTFICPALSQHRLTRALKLDWKTQEHSQNDWVGGGRASLARGHACSPVL